MKVYIVFEGSGLADPILEVVCATEDLAKVAMEELVQRRAESFHEHFGVRSKDEELHAARRSFYIEEVDVRTK